MTNSTRDIFTKMEMTEQQCEGYCFSSWEDYEENVLVGGNTIHKWVAGNEIFKETN
ncbi:hypothetical protein [Halobacillus amylolyticus]|uniref:Uncharacterized protein n=1 Tax=Halobacillus amylolyticus TaxID=2932259 RepID=A0ABY4HDA9_9BACI|nr:hypothetical protein [Halobacillus amylolyticus]UOR12880.1 hypothetical protein MUO15_05055 [Halobacillus amylolyticus]